MGLDHHSNIWHNQVYTMANRSDRTPKRQALRQTGTLNPRPDRVTDELFADSDFFDPNDLLQVKYEMLRRGGRDDFTVKQSSAAIWLFASLLLSGSGGVHARRLGRAGAAEARTETRSQAVAEGCGIPRADHYRRSRSGPGRRRAAGVRYLGAPTEHRAGVSPREKRTTFAMTGHDGSDNHRDDSHKQVTRYEDLRCQVIGHGGGPPAGAGAVPSGRDEGVVGRMVDLHDPRRSPRA